MVDSRPDSTPSPVSVLQAFLADLPSGRYVIACSGGSDSVALVRAAAAARQSLGSTVTIVHVDHRLRGRESARDKAFVVSLAKRLGFSVRVLVRAVAKGRGNLEERAREARYEALVATARRLKARLILTGHTEDDQAETVLMNALRGCGTDGLAGIPPLRIEGGTLIGRPWLTMARETLRAYLASLGQTYREDSSNRDSAFLRNYLRLKVFKDLERRSPGFRARLARLASLARSEQAVWTDWTESAWKRFAKPFRGGFLISRGDLEAMPLALQRRFLRRAAGRDLLTFDGVERLRIWMHSPPSNGRMLELRKGWMVERLSRTGGSPTSSSFWIRGPNPRPRSRSNRLK